VIYNRRYREVIGLPDGMLVGGMPYRRILEEMVARDLVPEIERSDGQAWIASRVEAPRNRSIGRHGLEVVRGERTLELREYRLLDGSGIVFLVDIEDLRQRELQLRQSQKMEALGQLTGGISHDFNNLLAVIQGNLSFLDDELPVDSEWRTFTSPALRAAKRGASLTKRLLSFAHQDELSSGQVDIAELLTTLGELLTRSLGVEVETVIDTEPGL